MTNRAMQPPCLWPPRRRPHFQRAFISWLRANDSRFEVPVRVDGVNTKGVTLCFPNFADCLAVWLTHSELSVSVEWQGECWDLLISLDVCPQFDNGVYRCGFCTQSSQAWPNLEALWLDHLYEPFLLWVNEKLATAQNLTIHGSERGVSWATLNFTKANSADSETNVAEIYFHSHSLLIPKSVNSIKGI